MIIKDLKSLIENLPDDMKVKLCINDLDDGCCDIAATVYPNADSDLPDGEDQPLFIIFPW